MPVFQLTALLLTTFWLVLVVVFFHRSNSILLGGLFAIGLFTLAAVAFGKLTLDQLGLGRPHSWLASFGMAVIRLGIMIACSPLADRLASRWVTRPPTLEAFGVIQRSRAKLVAGILAAWVLGGFLEELVARGIVLNSIQSLLAPLHIGPLAAGAAVLIAALGAGLMHLYQGPRAAAIITQLSILLGILFVVSGFNLWTVIICHGLYDTVAFVRFAAKKSKYSKSS